MSENTTDILGTGVSTAQGIASEAPVLDVPVLAPEVTKEIRKKTFQKAFIQRVITVSLSWPALYPDFEPWVFRLRLALSKEMNEKREEWLALPAAQRNAKEKVREEVVSEVCDLLVDYPSGFGDLMNSGDPGKSFRAYYDSTTDAEQKETLYAIIEAASNGYWAKALPREFRP